MDIMKVRIRKLRITDIYCELFSGTQVKAFTGVNGLVVRFILCLSTVKPLQRVLLRFCPCFLVMWPLVAVNEENKIIGYAWLNVERRLGEGFSTVLGIGTKRGYRGMGIGTTLMKELVLRARRNRVKRISLTVSSENVNAINLYVKFGFKTVKEVAERKWYMGPERYINMERIIRD